MQERMKNIISWSGGKDSTATIVLAHEHNIPIDLIIISLVWFDKKNKIYGEYPELIDWIFNHAIPLFESWGYPVKVVESEHDYLYWFFHKLTKSKVPERNGKYEGFVISGLCKMNDEKTAPLKKALKQIGNYQSICGIAADEPKRLEAMHKRNQISLLEQFNIKESETYKLLEPYNLLSPIYKFSKRSGCWFCPNKRISEMVYLKKNHPDLYNMLYELSKTENLVTPYYAHKKTFNDLDREVENYINNPPCRQISFIEICENHL